MRKAASLHLYLHTEHLQDSESALSGNTSLIEAVFKSAGPKLTQRGADGVNELSEK